MGLPEINYESEQGDLFQRIPENQRSIHRNIDSPPMINRIADWKTKIKRSDRYIIELIGKKSLQNLNYEIPEKLSVIPGFYALFFYFWIIYIIPLWWEKIIFHIKRVLR